MHTHEICHGCPQRIVCRCLQITEAQLVDALHTLELRTLKDVRRVTGAGEGCTCCHATLKEYLHEHAYCVATPVCSAE
jgi:bacterioferritin-associated ferredoxin